ncbi:EamA family transporter [Pseudomonas edaphica]|uniref:EamA family transporter n=1 Tax=Pseudomonas edaphica TaxID=2006980 RepID=UPI003D106F5A
MVYAIAVLCVFGIAAGQIMFKISASSLQRAGTFFDLKTLMILGSAFALYGLTTIAWVWVLQKVELGKAYPLMALAFVLVPIGSHFILGERFHTQYFVGVLFIMCGIILAVKS